MISCSTVRWRPERSLFALALPGSELLKFGRSTSKFSISVSSRQKVLDVFLSESSLRAQIFDNHLTARRLIVYDFTCILSLDDSLRLRSRCVRIGIARYSADPSLGKRPANSFDVLLDALFQHLAQLFRLVPNRHICRLENFEKLAVEHILSTLINNVAVFIHNTNELLR